LKNEAVKNSAGVDDAGGVGDPMRAEPTDPGTRMGPQPPTYSRLSALAVALSAPSIFCGVLGVGSTLIVWAMIQFDPARIDFYLYLLAAAGPVAFLVRLHGLKRQWRVPSRAVSLALNSACVACALLVAVLRREMLHDKPSLVAMLAILTLGPALNAAVLLTDPDAAD
jgi:hypothetical protein